MAFEKLDELLEKLDKIQWTTYDNHMLGAPNGFCIKWRTDMIFDHQLQYVIGVYYRKASIATWGCTSNEQNALFYKFISKWKSIIQEKTFDREASNSEKGLKILNEL